MGDVGRRFELRRARRVVAEGIQFVQPTIVVFPDGLRQRMPADWCRLVPIAGRGPTVLLALG